MASRSKIKKLEAVSVDDFLEGNYESSDDQASGNSEGEDSGGSESDDESESEMLTTQKNKSRNKTKNKKKLSRTSPEQRIESKQVDSESSKHKQVLDKMKDTDPEFYKYLEENDRDLLDFDVSDSSDEDEDKDKLHQPPSKLEVASDDSEDEVDDVDGEEERTKKGAKITVTMKMINKWTHLLKVEEPTTETLLDVIQAFRAAVEQAQGSSMKTSSMYKVGSSAIFNAVMRMCIVNLPSALDRILKLPARKPDQIVSVSACKRWPKVQVFVKNYLADLLKVLLVVAEPAIVTVLLKHAYQMVPYITATNKFAKGFLKKLVQFWATGEETVRVLAFMAIVKITRIMADQLYEFVLKSMYMSFVKHCKFTSPSTWPTINFMKRSLVEIFALDENQAYQYAFVYIRQLAIHLRNAITVKKKDSIKAVYNWQYIHCLNFFAQLLSSMNQSDIMRPLIYPLVQTVIGTICLVSTAKYYPLRFHCIRALTLLSQETKTFIPVLPLLTEVLELTDFNKKHSRQSWKPLDFLCMLKLSKVQLAEQGFKDGLLDHLYELLLDYFNIESHKIGFPELALPTIIKLKSFLKKCKVSNYCKQIRQILEKVEENSKFINNKRKGITLNLNDCNAITALETQLKLQGTPIGKYYLSYRKLRDRELLHGITKKGQLESVDNLPEVKRRELMEKHKSKDKEDFTDLFADETESDSDVDLFSKKAIKDEDEENNECTDLTDVTSTSEDEDEDEDEVGKD